MKLVQADAYRPWRIKRFEAAEIDSTEVSPSVEDYTENAFLYRRIQPISFNGEPADTAMRWFAGSNRGRVPVVEIFAHGKLPSVTTIVLMSYGVIFPPFQDGHYLA